MHLKFTFKILNGDGITDDLENLNNFLEDTGKLNEIDYFDEIISKHLDELNNLESEDAAVEIISDKNDIIINLKKEKNELVKKSLMRLYSKMKKDHKHADEEHARYVQLYSEEREKKHDLERKMMNLKLIVYKDYGVRLV